MEEILEYSLIQYGDFNLTLGAIIKLALIFVVTWFTIFLIVRIIGQFFKARNLDIGRKQALNQLISYFLWIVAIVMALDTIGVKVTLVLAGSAALLVGIGFGLQQIFQDLISGIFILIEGTVKINDVIEIDGLIGKILTIGLRTSSVLTRDGIIIIVPNHRFINENIINWSHNATATRFKVSVGVAYGSDVELVRNILIDCAKNHEDCINDDKMKDYAPFARFVDFGESSLDFELYFWSDNIFRIESTKSDLRFMIDRKFRENKVTIPFPQRDVHMKNP